MLKAVNFSHILMLVNPTSEIFALFVPTILLIRLSNGVADQLGAVKINGVGILMVDFTPQRLKLFLSEVFVKRVCL